MKLKKYDTLLDLLDALDDLSMVFINDNGKSYGYEGPADIDVIDYHHPNKKVKNYEIKRLQRNKLAVEIWVY